MKLLPSDSPLAHIFSAHHGHTGFIARLDRTSLLRKRLLFLRSLIYNIALLAAIMTLFMCHDFASNVPQAWGLTFSVTQGLILFWAISILYLTTFAPFFFGECLLRWKYGFKPTEVIIRRSPRESLSETESSEKHWRVFLRAINPALLYSNPAAILAADFWVLEHHVIMDVYAAISAGQVNEEDLEFTVWKEHDGVWSGLELWRLHHIVSVQQEVDLFKTLLRSKGKHDLLSAWERSFDNEKYAFSPTPEDYRSIVQRFSQEGIDYEATWSQVHSMDVA